MIELHTTRWCPTDRQWSLHDQGVRLIPDADFPHMFRVHYPVRITGLKGGGMTGPMNLTRAKSAVFEGYRHRLSQPFIWRVAS